MPVTIFLNTRYTQPTSHTELNDLLIRVRENTGKDWRLSEQKFTEVTGFWPFLKRKMYVEVSFPEFQIINFYRDNTGTSINESNEADYVAAYFHGILANVCVDSVHN